MFSHVNIDVYSVFCVCLNLSIDIDMYFSWAVVVVQAFPSTFSASPSYPCLWPVEPMYDRIVCYLQATCKLTSLSCMHMYTCTCAFSEGARLHRVTPLRSKFRSLHGNSALCYRCVNNTCITYYTIQAAGSELRLCACIRSITMLCYVHLLTCMFRHKDEP